MAKLFINELFDEIQDTDMDFSEFTDDLSEEDFHEFAVLGGKMWKLLNPD